MPDNPIAPPLIMGELRGVYRTIMWEAGGRLDSRVLIHEQNLRINLSSGGATPDSVPAEAEAEYCCVHLHNRDDDAAVVWVELSAPSDSVEVDVGLTPGGILDTGDPLADAQAALANVEFSRPTSLEEGLVLPEALFDGKLAVWVRLTINAGHATAAPLIDYCLIVFESRPA